MSRMETFNYIEEKLNFLAFRGHADEKLDCVMPVML